MIAVIYNQTNYESVQRAIINNNIQTINKTKFILF